MSRDAAAHAFSKEGLGPACQWPLSSAANAWFLNQDRGFLNQSLVYMFITQKIAEILFFRGIHEVSIKNIYQQQFNVISKIREFFFLRSVTYIMLHMWYETRTKQWRRWLHDSDSVSQSVFGLLSVDVVVQFQIVTVIVICILQKTEWGIVA